MLEEKCVLAKFHSDTFQYSEPATHDPKHCGLDFDDMSLLSKNVGALSNYSQAVLGFANVHLNTAGS